MPLFSKRKAGKQKSKISKHGAGTNSPKTLQNHNQRLKEHEISSQQHFNGVLSTPDTSRKDYLAETVQRPSYPTAKCVANFPRRSRLSKSLTEVLVDDSVLPLFMEFLQKQGVQKFLNFWLAAETFRLSSRDKTSVCFESTFKEQSSSQDSGNNFNSNRSNDQKDPGVLIPAVNSTDDNRFTSKNDNTRANLLSKLGSSDSCSSDDRYESTLSSSCCNLSGPTSAPLSEPSTLEESKVQKYSWKDVNCSTSEATGQDSSERRISNSNKYFDLRKDVTETQKQTDERKSDFIATHFNRCVVDIPPSPKRNWASHQEYDENRELRRQSKTMMDDALSIYRHFISLDATQPLGVDEATRREVESNICSENGEIDPECFEVPQKFAFETLENRYFDEFVRSSYYQKHIMDILTSGKIFLADIMFNDNAVFYFMEFMEQEKKSSLLAFWFAVDSFRAELQSKLDRGEYNVDEALADAMVLYDKYFSMQATNPFGVSDETRIRIENKICREGGPLPDCFEEPMENILTLLEEVYFPIFLESSVYFKYLNELLGSMIDMDSEQTSAGADDCSSTTSGTETSKLMESLVNDGDVQEDPTEIWQRPNFGLSIGRVNEYGVYEPWIEPQPGKGQKSGAAKFGQKMKKFVSGDSNKIKEELAWQVAKMVLEDVKKQQGKAPRLKLPTN